MRLSTIFVSFGSGYFLGHPVYMTRPPLGYVPGLKPPDLPLGTPVSVAFGRLFQADGPATAKARRPFVYERSPVAGYEPSCSDSMRHWEHVLPTFTYGCARGHRE